MSSPPPGPESYVASLRVRGRTQVGLDDVAEVLGDRASEVELVAAVLDLLENEGVLVATEPSVDLGGLLFRVLDYARRARAEGRSVTIAAIASALAIDSREVRVALLYAEVLARG